MKLKLLLVTSLALTLAACGGSSGGSSVDDQDTTDVSDLDSTPGGDVDDTGDTGDGSDIDSDTGRDTTDDDGSDDDATDVDDVDDATDVDDGDVDDEEFDNEYYDDNIYDPEDFYDLDLTPNIEGVAVNFSVSDSPTPMYVTRFDARASWATDFPELSFEWDFGDGATGEGVRVGHIYEAAGEYTVHLTVRADDGRVAGLEREIVVAEPEHESGIVRFWVLDELGSPVVGAELMSGWGTVQGESDSQGRLEAFVQPVQPKSFRFRHPSFADSYVRVDLSDASDLTNVQVVLKGREPAFQLVDAAAGGRIVGRYQASVEFEPDSLVYASNGQPVEGSVAVHITPLSRDEGDDNHTFGGEAALAPNGSLDRMVRYGGAEIVLYQGLKEVVLAPGREATVEIPIWVEPEDLQSPPAIRSLHRESGVWLEADAEPTVVPLSRGGFALRGRVSQLHSLSADRLLHSFRGEANWGPSVIAVSTRRSGTTEEVSGDFTLEVDYSGCLNGGSYRDVQHIGSGRSGYISWFENCDTYMKLYSADGRYFYLDDSYLGRGVTWTSFPLADREELPILRPGAPLDLEFDDLDYLYFRYDVSAGDSVVIKVDVDSASDLVGSLEVFNGNFEPGAQLGFDSSSGAMFRGFYPEEATMIVRVKREAGEGGAQISFRDDEFNSLNNGSYDFELSQGGKTITLVRGNRYELGRIMVEGVGDYEIYVKDQNREIVSRPSLGSELGLFEFPNGEGLFVEVVQVGGPAGPGTVHYQPATMVRPLGFLTDDNPSKHGSLNPGDVHVYQVPYSDLAGIHAHMQNMDTPAGLAPQIGFSVVPRRGAAAPGEEFPDPVLTHGERRHPNGSQAYVVGKMDLDHEEGEEPLAMIYVSTPDFSTAIDYFVEMYLVRSSNDITVGSCEGSVTRSIHAGVAAIDEGGIVRLCPGTYPIHAGLEIRASDILIQGDLFEPVLLRQWEGQTDRAAITNELAEDRHYAKVGLRFFSLEVPSGYGGVDIVGEEVNFRDLSISTPQPIPYLHSMDASACVTVGGLYEPDGDHYTYLRGVTCDGFVAGVIAENLDGLSITESEFYNHSDRGVFVNGGSVDIDDSLFDEVHQPMYLTRVEPGIRLVRNSVASRQDANPSAPGGHAQVLVDLQRTDDPDARAGRIADNVFTMAGDEGSGIALNARGGNTVFVERNLFRGHTAQGQRAFTFRSDRGGRVHGILRIFNNVFTGIAGNAIYGEDLGDYEAVAIMNNSFLVDVDTAHHNAAVVLLNDDAGAGYLLSSLYFQNNICAGVDPAGVGVAFSNGLPLTADYNHFSNMDAYMPYVGSNPDGLWALSTNDIPNSDPLFAEEDLLTLDPSSPSVDSGGDWGPVPADDFYGASRPQGAGIDRGAHEQ